MIKADAMAEINEVTVGATAPKVDMLGAPTQKPSLSIPPLSTKYALQNASVKFTFKNG